VRFRNGAPCTASDPRACAGCASASPNAVQRVVSAAAVRQYRRRNAAAFARHKTIFVSEFLRRRLDAIVPLNGSRSFVIHNFVDLNALPRLALAQAAAPAHATRIVIASRIDAMKGVEAFLEALRHRRSARVEVEIVGDGPLRARAEQTFASRSVRFLGWCSQPRTLEHLARAQLVVVPSVWDEPCATTILEGLALGKRVFALARGGTPELKRYERWPGQLALFESMKSLVAAVLDERPAPRPAAREFRADVALALPRILAVYEQGSRA
jgi:glycosyltransferase involved in cell wall biosynthesis